jgi:hypothetical protein
VSVGSDHRHKALAERVTEGVDILRRLELARLDSLPAAVWDKALAGETAAGNTVLRIIEQRTRMLSLGPSPPHTRERASPARSSYQIRRRAHNVCAYLPTPVVRGSLRVASRRPPGRCLQYPVGTIATLRRVDGPWVGREDRPPAGQQGPRLAARGNRPTSGSSSSGDACRDFIAPASMESELSRQLLRWRWRRR